MSRDMECLDDWPGHPKCAGDVKLRDALSPTGKMFPRCDKHWELRLDIQQGINERYPEHPPHDWSPLDAGESWYEDGV